MSTSPLKLFDAYDMQFSRSEYDRNHIQDTIDYCECRFRNILHAVSGSMEARQMVLQRNLFSELVNNYFTKIF